MLRQHGRLQAAAAAALACWAVVSAATAAYTCSDPPCTVRVGVVSPQWRCPAACEASVGVRLAMKHIRARSTAVMSAEVVGQLRGDLDFEPVYVDSMGDPDHSVRELVSRVHGAGASVVVSSASPAVMQPLAVLASALRMGTISYAPPSMVNTNSAQRRGIARLLPGNSAVYDTVIALCRHYGWRNIAVLHPDDVSVGSLSDYISQFRVFSGVEVVVSTCYVSGDQASIDFALQEIYDSSARVIVSAMAPEETETILRSAADTITDGNRTVRGPLVGPGFVWISTSLTASPLAVATDAQQLAPLLQGMLSVEVAAGQGAGEWAALKREFAAQDVGNYTDILDPLTDAGYFTSEPTDQLALAYDATWIAVLAANNALADSGVSTSTDGGVVSLDASPEVLVAEAGRLSGMNGTSGRLEFNEAAEREAASTRVAVQNYRFNGAATTLENMDIKAVFSVRWQPGEEVAVLEAVASDVAPLGVEWAGHPTVQSVPRDVLSCPQEQSFDFKAQACGTNVVLMLPDADDISVQHGIDQQSVVVAAALAVEHVNTRDFRFVYVTDNDPFVSGFRLHLFAVRGVNNSDRAVEHAVGLLSSSTREFAAVVGEMKGEVSEVVGNLASTLSAPIVSSANMGLHTHKVAQSQRHLQVAPSDKAAAHAMADALLAFGFLRVAILSGSTKASFVTSFQEACGQVGIRILYLGSSLGSEDSVAATVQGARDSGARIFVLTASAELERAVLTSALQHGILGEHFAWFMTDDNFLSDSSADDTSGPLAERGMEGTFVLKAGAFPPSLLDSEWESFATSGRDVAYLQLAWLNGEQTQKELEISTEVFTTLSAPARLVYDAIWIAALGLGAEDAPDDVSIVEDIVDGNDSNTRRLHRSRVVAQRMKQIRFQGVSGTVEFDTDGLRSLKSSSFELLNVQWVPGAETVTGKLEAVAVGSWRPSSGGTGRRLGEFTMHEGATITWPGGVQASPHDGSCPSGHEFSESSHTCEACAAGSFADEHSSICLPCPAGTFSALPRQDSCVRCDGSDGNGYQDEEGQSSCKACPPLTARRLGSPGVNISECVCVPGSYRQGLAANECVPCPPSSQCSGMDAPPVPRRGWWSEPSSPTSVYPCHSGGDTCPGGRSGRCGNGHAQFLCSECSDGRFRVADWCLQCPEGSTASTLTAFGGFFAVWVAMFYLRKIFVASNPTLIVLVLNLQLLAHIQEYSVSWPIPLKTTKPLFQLINFDLSVWSPRCAIPGWSRSDVYMIQLLFPAASVVMQGLALACAHVRLAWLGNPRKPSRDDDGQLSPVPRRIASDEAVASGRPRNVSSRPPGAGGVPHCCGAMFRGLPNFVDEVSHYGDGCIASAFSTVFATYNILVLAALQTLACTESSDGSFAFMTSSPSVKCWDSLHVSRYVIPGILSLLVLLIIVPVFLWNVLAPNRGSCDSSVTTAYVKHGNIFTDERFLKRYGWLYKRFRHPHHRWELFLLARRALISVSVVVLRGAPIRQCVAGLSILALCHAIHMRMRPYAADSADAAETLGMACGAFYLVCGMVFEADRSSSTGLTSVLLIVLGVLAAVTVSTLVGSLFSHAAEDSRRLDAKVKKLSGTSMSTLMMRALEFGVAALNVLSSSHRRRSSAVDDVPRAGRRESRGEARRRETESRIFELAATTIASPGREKAGSRGDGDESDNESAAPGSPMSRGAASSPGARFTGSPTSRSTEMSPTARVLEYIAEELGDLSDAHRSCYQSAVCRVTGGQSNAADNADPPGAALQVLGALNERRFHAWTLHAVRQRSSWMVGTLLKGELILGDVVCDKSELSVFSTAPEASFFNKLLDTFPTLLDWVICAGAEDIAGFRRFVTSYLKMYCHRGTTGSVAELLLPAKRGPVVGYCKCVPAPPSLAATCQLTVF